MAVAVMPIAKHRPHIVTEISAQTKLTDSPRQLHSTAPATLTRSRFRRLPRALAAGLIVVEGGMREGAAGTGIATTASVARKVGWASEIGWAVGARNSSRGLIVFWGRDAPVAV